MKYLQRAVCAVLVFASVLAVAALEKPALEPAVAKALAGVRGSDFAPFMEKDIPSASIGSNGPHLAYHAVGDTIYRINPTVMADIAKVSFLASLAWADR